MCKIAHNVMLGVVIENLIEITLLANKMGVPRHAFLAFMNNGVMGSMFTAYKTPALVNLDWTATFSEPVLGFTKSDIQLGGPDADEWYINWLLGQDASYEFLTKQDVRLNGTFTVSLPAWASTSTCARVAL